MGHDGVTVILAVVALQSADVAGSTIHVDSNGGSAQIQILHHAADEVIGAAAGSVGDDDLDILLGIVQLRGLSRVAVGIGVVGVGAVGIGAAAAGQGAHQHQSCKSKGHSLFHVHFLLFIILSLRSIVPNPNQGRTHFRTCVNSSHRQTVSATE